MIASAKFLSCGSYLVYGLVTLTHNPNISAIVKGVWISFGRSRAAAGWSRI